ncbi:MAG TPA: outer membrane lipoprotein-sorting protein [Burkholderiaceae bacterium]|jgi:hypothetical protein
MHTLLKASLAFIAMAALYAAAADLPVDEIMNRNFYAAKVKTLTYDATMILVNDKGQQRERKISGASRLQPDGIDVDLAIRFNFPADVNGTRFLQLQHADRDDDMWIYLPALKRSRRLVASNKRDSFVGSDFSYADILPPRPALFRNVLQRSEAMQGFDCYVIESSPQDDNLKHDLGYSRRVSWIRKDNFVELKVDYYDLGGQLFRTQSTADHKMVESEPQRWLALRRDMQDLQSGHKTSFTLDKVDTKQPVAARMFSAESLERD